NFRQAIVNLGISHQGTPMGQLTISAGVVVCRPQLSSSLSDLLNHADQLLYQAKTQGRNRIQLRVLE
ncbi:MAG: GGDEF domain-containing protein, partial [Comamonadaceae bacterium]|nr:GGDEF domain-containing protein [Comamonadaceae bacterium]